MPLIDHKTQIGSKKTSNTLIFVVSIDTLIKADVNEQ
ncbi:hypothetical protein HDC92_002792 [Pedobacter sp. AK017]|nr:hypothetical protein [Pedobacter sp. AK017]